MAIDTFRACSTRTAAAVVATSHVGAIGNTGSHRFTLITIARFAILARATTVTASVIATRFIRTVRRTNNNRCFAVATYTTRLTNANAAR
jgi:hypothetical protein